MRNTSANMQDANLAILNIDNMQIKFTLFSSHIERWIWFFILIALSTLLLSLLGMYFAVVEQGR